MDTSSDGDAMTEKESLLQMIRELPDDASLEEIADAVILRMKVERGRRQIEEGRGLSQEEAKEHMARWLA